MAVITEKPSRRPSPQLIIGLVAGLLGAAIILAVPREVLNGFAEATGIGSFIAAAKPPLGLKARILLAILSGLFFAVSSYFAFGLLKPKLLGRKRAATAAEVIKTLTPSQADLMGELSASGAKEEGGFARPPIFAERELGAPFMAPTSAPVAENQSAPESFELPPAAPAIQPEVAAPVEEDVPFFSAPSLNQQHFEPQADAFGAPFKSAELQPAVVPQFEVPAPVAPVAAPQFAEAAYVQPVVAPIYDQVPAFQPAPVFEATSEAVPAPSTAFDPFSVAPMVGDEEPLELDMMQIADIPGEEVLPAVQDHVPAPQDDSLPSYAATDPIPAPAFTPELEPVAAANPVAASQIYEVGHAETYDAEDWTQHVPPPAYDMYDFAPPMPAPSPELADQSPFAVLPSDIPGLPTESLSLTPEVVEDSAISPHTASEVALMLERFETGMRRRQLQNLVASSTLQGAGGAEQAADAALGDALNTLERLAASARG